MNTGKSVRHAPLLINNAAREGGVGRKLVEQGTPIATLPVLPYYAPINVKMRQLLEEK
jgi:hypothetical protein